MNSTYKNNKNKKFEFANYVPEDRDSILELPFDEVVGGQVYVSEDKIREIVKDELKRRFGSCKKNIGEYNE